LNSPLKPSIEVTTTLINFVTH